VPYYLQVLQALATPAIALLAVAIGWGQWWTARQRLSLDLFDKRFSTFMDIRRIASEAIQLGKLNNYASVNEIVARSRFLFGDDILQKVIELHGLTCRLETRDSKAAIEISNLFDDMLPLFGRYLRMDQKTPRLPWN
jgi:hypothetical protein